MKLDYYPFEQGVIRTPLYDLTSFLLEFENKNADFFAYLKNPTFLELIYLSSYELYKVILSTKQKSRAIDAIMKYFSRASTRPTPFGLCATVSAFGIEDDKTSFEIESYSNHNRAARLDNEFVFKVYRKALELHPESFFNQSIYYLNNTIYHTENNVFYTKRTTNGKSIFSVAEYQETLIILITFMNEGRSMEDIMKEISRHNKEANSEDIIQFVKELINENLIINEFEILKLNNFVLFDSLVKFLKENASNSIFTQSLLQVNLLITGINNSKLIEPAIETFEKIRKIFSDLDIDGSNRDNIFQIDTYTLFKKANYNKNKALRHVEALDLLFKISSGKQVEGIKLFKEKFQERYGDQEILLVEAINKETGIGYQKSRNFEDQYSDYLNDVDFNYAKSSALYSLSPFQTTLIKKIEESRKTFSKVIKIKKEDIEQIQYDRTKLPNTINIIFTELNNDKYLLYPTGNSSASSMIARFSNNDKINILCEKIVNKDDSNPNGKCYEIDHIPNHKSMNVTSRQFNRKRSVAIFSRKDDTHTVSVSNILIGIDSNNKIYLKNKINNELIIPHYSHVYDYRSELPIYSFLGDLQSENSFTPLLFEWGNLEKFYVHFPRVEYKNYILHPEMWIVSFDDFDTISLDDTDFLIKMEEAYKKNKLSAEVLIAEDDNELPINLSNEVSAKVFFKMLKSKKRLKLLENYISETNNLVKNCKDQIFSHQIILPYFLKNEEKTDAIVKNHQNNISSSSRYIYPLQDNFLYLKLYGGVKLVENLLIDGIVPLTQDFINQNKISKWFFIRYDDANPHLRLRFFFKSNPDMLEFYNLLSAVIKNGIDSKLAYKFVIDTYDRELERYIDIDEAEHFFYKETQTAIKLLKIKKHFHQNASLTYFVCIYIDDLLSSLGFNLSHKKELLKICFESTFSALGLTKKTRVSLDSKFRENKIELTNALSTQLIENKNVKNLYNHSDVKLSKNIIPSIIHMSCNRFFTSHQNLNELVVYNFLYKFYLQQSKKILDL